MKVDRYSQLQEGHKRHSCYEMKREAIVYILTAGQINGRRRRGFQEK